jgi:hypothetical protein
MHAGPTDPDSPMPWRLFNRISDTDARALFRYLRSLPPSDGAAPRGEPVASNP